MTAAELRPRSLGELLDHTFTLYRRHFILFVGIMALPQMFAVAINLFVQAFQQPQARAASSSEGAAVAAAATLLTGAAVMGVVYWVVYSVALGASTCAVSDVFLGRTISIRGAYERIRGRFWRIMDVVFSMMVRVFGVIMLSFLVAGALAGVLAAALTGTGGTVAVVAGTLLGMGLAVWLALRYALRYAVAVPVALVEDRKARAALRRSTELMKGNLGRAFLILVLFYMVTYAAMFLIQGPFLVAMFVMAGKGGTPPLWLTHISTIMGGAAGTLTAPMMMIGLVLLYYDVRIRREAFDLNYMLGTLDSPAPAPQNQ